jgi:sulfate adenylyltransferase subunit 2
MNDMTTTTPIAEPTASLTPPRAPTTHAHLDALEHQSVFIFREAYHHFKNVCMPWSMGKDSNVLIWLANKAFCGHIPFPVMHIDTTYEFPEMLEFREWAVKEYKLKLIVKINEEARAGTGPYKDRGPIGYDTADPVSPRNKDFEWDYKDQPPEFWNQFTTSCAPGEHVRVQPLLDWSESDIWKYIQRENIPIPKMYFARQDPTDGKMKRYRSLGCWPITNPIESTASNIDEIIAELAVTKTSERAGRAQDHYERNAMQKLRAKGFM